MPNKTEEYLALACKTADSFSRQWEHWAEFLITAARLYKYSYPDQLMIYAQRPDATACAEYNELCDKGSDVDFGKKSTYMHKIEKAPFWASASTSACLPFAPV